MIRFDQLEGAAETARKMKLFSEQREYIAIRDTASIAFINATESIDAIIAISGHPRRGPFGPLVLDAAMQVAVKNAVLKCLDDRIEECMKELDALGVAPAL